MLSWRLDDDVEKIDILSFLLDSSVDGVTRVLVGKTRDVNKTERRSFLQKYNCYD